jgi:hypothetical protein
MGRSGKLHDLAEPKRGGLQARLRRVTEVAAVFYSLLESAKVAGVEPPPTSAPPPGGAPR